MRLTVKIKYERKQYNNWFILQIINAKKCIAKCSCGGIKLVYYQNIIRNLSHSCGECLMGKLTKEKRTLNLMNYRCSTPSSSDYSRYGGRGIECRFKNVEEFVSAIGEYPKDGAIYTVDRIDNNGHYEIGNVRWATCKQQSRNTRKTTYVMWDGNHVPLIDLIESHGLKHSTVRERIKRGWSLERSLKTPVST